MEIKLFGKKLFEVKKSDRFWEPAQMVASESKYLPDFYSNIGNTNTLENYVVVSDAIGSPVAVKMQKRGGKKIGTRTEVTPKGVYEMKMLHDESFKLNTNPEYIEKQISDFKDKLSLIKSEEYDMRNGVNEIASVIVRLENRKKYESVKDFFEAYPYTSTSRINTLIKSQDHLKVGQIAQFIADMPKEAVDAMKEYNKHTDMLCGKQAVFYIIANKKDFKKTDGRRDPILLAQSPFGHFWQILGAWDEEMMFLEEL